MNKNVFAPTRGPATDTVNEAGGQAYSRSPEDALAQLACTGTLNQTFYTSEQDQLGTVLQVATSCDPSYVAKVARYARREGMMKDMPALLTALLSTWETEDFEETFPVVINSGKMLRNFFQVLRSGVVGRRSMSGRVRRAMHSWFEQDPSFIFRNSVGSDPSMGDILRMARPRPLTERHSELFSYLVGSNVVVNAELMPDEFRKLVQFSKGTGEAPRGLPFEMLASYALDTKSWSDIARVLSWTATRMNLNTLGRHGVLDDLAMVDLVARRLEDPEAVAEARPFPYQLMVAHANFDGPDRIHEALETAMEHSTRNVPKLEGRVVVAVDVSYSMSSPITGHRSGSTTKVRCVDVAALIAACVKRSNPDARIVEFANEAREFLMNPRDTVMTNARNLSDRMGGGTNLSSALELVEKSGWVDTLLVVSDNQSWMDSPAQTSGRSVAQSIWRRIHAMNRSSLMVAIDLQPYTTSQVSDGTPGYLQVGGWSDALFRAISRFRLADGDWRGMVE